MPQTHRAPQESTQKAAMQRSRNGCKAARAPLTPLVSVAGKMQGRAFDTVL